jgi:hypothetical protein
MNEHEEPGAKFRRLASANNPQITPKLSEEMIVNIAGNYTTDAGKRTLDLLGIPENASPLKRMSTLIIRNNDTLLVESPAAVSDEIYVITHNHEQLTTALMQPVDEAYSLVRDSAEKFGIDHLANSTNTAKEIAIIGEDSTSDFQADFNALDNGFTLFKKYFLAEGLQINELTNGSDLKKISAATSKLQLLTNTQALEAVFKGIQLMVATNGLSAREVKKQAYQQLELVITNEILTSTFTADTSAASINIATNGASEVLPPAARSQIFLEMATTASQNIAQYKLTEKQQELLGPINLECVLALTDLVDYNQSSKTQLDKARKNLLQISESGQKSIAEIRKIFEMLKASLS